METTKTVVEVDLVGYSDMARLLDDNLGARIVAEFHSQIQAFVDKGLAEIDSMRERAVLATTGDGAILAFESPLDAHRFAVALQIAAMEHNHDRDESAHRWFRIGLATGELFQGDGNKPGQRMAGIVIVNAVRLEAAARPGQLLAHSSTYSLLPPKFRKLYGPEELIAGKRNERIPAHRYAVVPYITSEDSRPTVLSALDLFDQLNPRDQLNTIMLLIGLPPQFRPPEFVPVFKRQEAIIDWTLGTGNAGLSELTKALKYLIQKQRIQP